MRRRTRQNARMCHYGKTSVFQSFFKVFGFCSEQCPDGPAIFKESYLSILGYRIHAIITCCLYFSTHFLRVRCGYLVLNTVYVLKKRNHSVVRTGIHGLCLREASIQERVIMAQVYYSEKKISNYRRLLTPL